MHLRLIMFPSIHRLRSRTFTRVRTPVCSVSMRSSPGLTSLPRNSAPSRGLPSPPSQALAQPTAAWAGAADLTSIGKLRAPGGFRPGAVGTGNRRGCRRIHPLEMGPIPPTPRPNAQRPNDLRAAKDATTSGPIFDTMSASYGFVAHRACRCAVCESHRVTRLAQALHDKFGHGLVLTVRQTNKQ
jgi:hypothetical protein